MAEVTKLTPIKRPSGKIYRPRKVRCYAWENQDLDDGYGAVVLGTHDVELAEKLATNAIKYWFDSELIATKPEVGWFRSGYHHGEPTWIRDQVRGRAGVLFTADYPEDVSA